jgi:hypothetical protein
MIKESLIKWLVPDEYTFLDQIFVRLHCAILLSLTGVSLAQILSLLTSPQEPPIHCLYPSIYMFLDYDLQVPLLNMEFNMITLLCIKCLEQNLPYHFNKCKHIFFSKRFSIIIWDKRICKVERTTEKSEYLQSDVLDIKKRKQPVINFCHLCHMVLLDQIMTNHD